MKSLTNSTKYAILNLDTNYQVYMRGLVNKNAETYQDLIDETIKQILLIHGSNSANDESLIRLKDFITEVCGTYHQLLFSNKFVGVKQQ
jgi:hypothetical protein